jgi:hypothetical protein
MIDLVDRPVNEPSREVDSAQQRLKRRSIVGGLINEYERAA